MYKFIKHTFLFTSIFIGLILCVEFGTSHLIKRYSNFHFTPNSKYGVESGTLQSIRSYYNFHLTPNPKYIVIGHSHPECAFNDSILKDFRNISFSGESYFYTLFKTKKILEQNPSIKLVFMEYENRYVNESCNQWIWSDDKMGLAYPKYSSFMSISDKLLLLRNNPSGYLNVFSLSIKNRLKRILTSNFHFSYEIIGSYKYLIRNYTDSLVRNYPASESEFIKNSQEPLKHKYNLIYLSALIRYCKKMGKRVILIRSPLHKKYPGYVNEPRYKEILKSRYADIEYLDFSKFPLSNSEFGDLEHLNYKGAKVFSTWFAELLNKGLLEKPNKQAQAFIDNEIKILSITKNKN